MAKSELFGRFGGASPPGVRARIALYILSPFCIHKSSACLWLWKQTFTPDLIRRLRFNLRHLKSLRFVSSINQEYMSLLCFYYPPMKAGKCHTFFYPISMWLVDSLKKSDFNLCLTSSLIWLVTILGSVTCRLQNLYIFS